MNVFRMFERGMAMDDATWARHANPWSVYSRIAGFAFLVVAVWSRAWIGWAAVFPIALAAVWLWFNPRAFPPPVRTDNWASKATFGERVFLNRNSVPIPAGHVRAAHILSAISAAGALLLVYGFVVLHPWATITGFLITAGGKLWFGDRMVWLYETMKDFNPEYGSWLR